jgi:hypothetical protein
MRRRPSNLLTPSNLHTLLSLVLCTAVVALRVQSHRVTNWWEYRRHSPPPERRTSELSVGLGGGSALLGLGFFSEQSGRRSFPPPGRDWMRDTDDPEDVAERLGPTRFGFRFAYRKGITSPGLPFSQTSFRSWHVAFPLWAPAALFAALPLVRACRSMLRRRRLNRPGVCSKCGYDLRATPGRCPECGAQAVSPLLRQGELQDRKTPR